MRRGFHRSSSSFSWRFKTTTKSLCCSSSDGRYSFLSLLDSCSSMKELKQIHAQMITVDLVRYTYITSRVLAFCAISPKGDIHYASDIFTRIDVPTIFNWNTMIKGYSRTSKTERGLTVFSQMRSKGIEPNMHTFPFVIASCCGIITVSQVHGQTVKFGFDFDVYVVSSLIKVYSKYNETKLARQVFDECPSRNVVSWTSLITGYCLQGFVDDARKLFDEMDERTTVAWSAMITGYVHNDYFSEAIDLFGKFRSTNMKPNESILVSVLTACSSLGAFEEGKWIHKYTVKNKVDCGLQLGTALIDFYCKCGITETAQRLFNKMPSKDVMTWSAMIMGFATNGETDSALRIFSEMEEQRIKPNAVTYIGILSACSHGGKADEGLFHFKNMTKKYGISPALEHYGCMVDLLGRADMINNALQLIDEMPMKPDAIIWGALINGCMIHGHLELGEKVGRHLIELEPHHSGRYSFLSNIYATMGKWEGVVDARRKMREKRVTIVPGCSFIEIDGVVDKFLSDDRSHPSLVDIYATLDVLNTEMM